MHSSVSSTLTDIIQEEIQQAGGHISFARFMELALYAPGMGYYTSHANPFGKSGDFITAPEISPLFARCIARQIQQVLMAIPDSDILELGAGSGVFAKDVLLELEKLNFLPQHYFIFEISAALREQQQQFLQTHCPHLLTRVQWLDALPSTFSGVIFANEVLDAIPIHCFRITEDGIQERCVAWENNRFFWKATSPTSEDFTKKVSAIQQEYNLPAGYESEINLALPAWIKSLSTILEKGLILLCDYGYGRREYYHPDRHQGTFMCYHQHRRCDDPFQFVGLQDMTAHVDFTTVVEHTDLTLAGFTTQASFLLACGLLNLAGENSSTVIDIYQQNQAIKTLTLPSQMGEAVKIIGLSKDLNILPIGFSLHDRRRDL